MTYLGKTVVAALVASPALGVAFALSSAAGPAFVAVQLISLLAVGAITLYWYTRDAARLAIRPNPWVAVGLVWPGVSTLVVVGYMFWSRGLVGGAIATAGAMSLIAVCTFLLVASAHYAAVYAV